MIISVAKVLSLFISLVAFYFFLEIIKSKYKLHSRVTRKIAHITSGVAALITLYIYSYKELVALLSLFSLFFLLARRKKIFKSIHLETRVSYGEIFFPLGLLVIIFYSYYQKDIALISISILTFADSIAETVGNKFNKNKKSMIGSIAFFAVSLISIFIIQSIFRDINNFIFLYKAILFSIVLTVVEHLSSLGSDNLTVPIMSVIILKLFF